jgi:hypothetical protein
MPIPAETSIMKQTPAETYKNNEKLTELCYGTLSDSNYRYLILYCRDGDTVRWDRSMDYTACIYDKHTCLVFDRLTRKLVEEKDSFRLVMKLATQKERLFYYYAIIDDLPPWYETTKADALTPAD